MKFKKAAIFILILGLISTSGKVALEFLNGQQNAVQAFNKINLKSQENYSFTHAKLVEAIKELSRFEFANTKVESSLSNQTNQNEVKKVTAELDQFYIWLKKNQISLRVQLNDLIQEWETTQNKNERIKLKNKLQSYSTGLIKRGVKNFEQREYIRNTISKLANSMNLASQSAVETTTAAVRPADKNLELVNSVRELLEAFVINARDAKVELAQSIGQIQNEIKTNNKSVVVSLGIFSGISIILLMMMAFRRNNPEVREEIQESQKMTNTIVHDDLDNIASIKEIFSKTAYPVLLANSSYSILWNNEKAESLKLDSSRLKNAVKVLQAGQDGLHTVELNKKFFHFSINQIHNHQSSIATELSADMGDRKIFLIQLIPTEKPIFGHSTVIDKKSLQYIQSTYANAKNETFDINSLMAGILTKTNYIFQLSGTVIDYKSSSSEISCQIDRKMLENALKNVFIEIHGIIKDSPKIKKIGIEITSMDNRINFSFYVPGLTLTSELWQRKNTKIENGIQSALRFEEIEASMASYRCRLIMRAIEEEGNPVTEITLSVENRDHLRQFKQNSASINMAN